MKPLNEKQKESSAKLLYDLIKLVVLGFVIGGFVGEQGPKSSQIAVGAVASVVLYLVALWLERKT